MTTKSGKHANKIAKNAFDSAANNGVTKAVDMRKVAALSAGAAGVIAGAAIAFGATPAMAADTTSTPVDTSTSANAQDLTAKKSDEKQKSDEEQQADEANKKTTDSTPAPDNTTSKASTYAASNTPAEASAGPNYGQVREADPAPAPKVNSTIELSQDKKDTLPNMYAWGSSDNVYIEKGQNQSVTFKFAKPSDGSTITKVAIFPSDGNTVDNTKSRKFLEYYSDAAAVNEHQPYSGTYEFKVDTDGTATLTMTKLYRDGNLKSGESYSANRCIYVYGTDKDGKTVVLYKTNIVRAATLIPPKTAGSIVLKYNEELTAQQIQDKLKAALDAPTEATGKKSIRDQITAASTSRGVGGRTGENGAFVQTPDTAENKVIITDQNAYDANQLATVINKVTSKTGEPTTYVTGVNNLKTYLVSDLGYKSEALALTVARYDTRIEKPIVEDPTNVSTEVKEEIAKKLAQLNHVPQDKVTFNDKGEAVINFDGVDAADAPKIPLRDLVLKKLEEKDVTVPTGDKAVFVANPLGYSNAELDRIKTAIFEANKGNKELGLTSTDQISLSYLTGDLTASGDANKGISNGQAENKITVKIKTDKSVAEFTSNVKESKLTKLPDIRKDYDVTWTKTKIDGRDTDEGISWSNDQKTTIIYRYDPTKAEEFDTTKILGLLKAKPKDPKSGLRDLTGGETLAYEGTSNHSRKSHMNYALQNEEPTGELTLGNMGGAYWSGNQKVSNSDVDLGDNLSDAGSYSWDTEAGSVTVAAKKGKIFKARLFVEPYAMTYYKHVYLEQGRNPGNTAKAINVIFVPQTNHKTKDLSDSIGEHKTENVEGKDVPTQSKYYNASADKKDAYEKALKTATDLLATVKDKQEKDLTEEQKAQIDNATINLNKARAELDGPDTNKDGLNASIEANGKAAEGSTAATGTQATNQFKNVSDPDFKKADGSDDKDRNEAAKKAKTDYDNALAEANKVKEDKNATQKAVDEAKAKLDAAREKLNDFTTNKDELNNAIAKDGKVNTGDAKKTDPAEKLKTADPTYQNSTPEQRKAYDDAVAEADKVSKDPNASQKEVNEAIKKLKDAKDALDKNATDKAPLDAAVQKSLDKDPNKHSVFYTNAKNKTGDTAALNAAKELLKKPDATQKEVNDALKKLDDARKELDKYNTDTAKLKESVDKHGSTDGPAATEGTQTSDAYRNASDPHFLTADGKPDTKKNDDAKAAKKAYDEALTKAQELLKKHDDKDTPQDAKPTQTDINNALDALDKARTEVEKYKTVTTDLETEINKSTAEGAPAVTENDFENTPEFKNAKAKTSDGNENADVTAYKEALKKARELVKAAADQDKKNSERPSQQQINDALDALKAAKKQITDNYKTNLEPLTSAKDFADGDFKNTPEYKNALAKKTAGDPGATQALGEDGKDTGFDNILKKVAAKLNDADWKQKATQKEVNALLKQLKDAQEKIAKDYKTDAIKLEREVGDKDQDGKPVTPPFEASVAYKNALEKKNAGDATATEKLKAYVEKLAKANELIEKVKNPDPNAKPEDRPTQKQVDDALAALKQAKKDIDDNFKTKVEKLQNEVDDKNEDGTARTPKFEESTEFANLKGKTKDGKKPDDLVAYEQALAKAKELIDKNDGKVTKDGQEVDVPKDQLPTQVEVDEAQKALKEIKDKIIANYKTSPHDLYEEFDKSKDGDDDTRDGLFEDTPEFKNATAKGDDAAKNALDDYNKKLKAAKDLLDKFDRTTDKPKTNLPAGTKAPTQQELDKALKDLQDAKKKITDGYKTDPSKLKSEADADPDFTKTPEYVNAQAKGDDASKKDLEAYKKALEDANKVLGDKNATQKQVDDALKKLQDAKSKLTDGYKTDKNKLYQEKDNDPEFRKSIPFLIADGKDIAEYNKALNEANAVLADTNATQAQVDEALRKLQRIKQKMIDLYNSLGSGSDDDSDGGSTGANNANANAVDKSMLHAEVNGALADVANGAGAAGAANGAKGSKGALVDASVIKEFNDALENARRVLADPNATQEQVEAATMRLRAARAALNAAKANKGSNLRGNMGVQTGVDSATLSAFAAVFVGLAGLGVSAKRRKHAR